MTEAQSPDVEKRYIITAELLKELGRWDLTFNKMREIQNKIVSCPYDPDALKAEERERVLKKLIDKIDSCVLSCPKDARQKPKTMLMYFRKTCESLRKGAP